MRNVEKNKLIGSWGLISFESKSPEGIVTYPLGRNAQGIIIYTPDDYVSVNIMKEDRLSVVEKALYLDKDLKYLDLPYLSYTGRYMVDEIRSCVTHLVEICIYPEWVGQKQFRIIRWKGNDLELSSDTIQGSDQVQFMLLWRRNKK